MTFIDDFSPDYLESSAFRVTLSADTLSPAVNQAAIFLIDYSGADAHGGVSGPIEVILQAPTVAGFFRRTYRRVLPSEVVYFPIGGGKHLLTVKELGHNRFFGALPFVVAGDRIDIPVKGRG